VSRKFKLSQTSLNKINKYIDNNNLSEKNANILSEQIIYDAKMIKDCSEKSIVDFYLETCNELLKNSETPFSEEFMDNLKMQTRHKLVQKYVSKNTFDNSIDIYFNDVKREYILHPQGESEEIEFCDENRDIFIKNNLKLAIECAKRYQNLGLPFEDLIQIGNLGLLMAFEKFDKERSNLRISIVKDIKNSNNEIFTFEQAKNIITKNFKYTKLLDSTLKKIPENGFTSKSDFLEWTDKNIKKASFSSISFFWIKASILFELNNYGKIIKIPKSIKDKEKNSINIIRLDSLNPHTDDCYHDNQISEIANDEFVVEDESIQEMERKNIFKELISKLLCHLNPLDRRIIKKKFGIDLPFPMSINEIAENEGITSNKVKYSLTSSMKIIGSKIPAKDKETIIELLR
jgi:RNA polymerase sigma factor (sigma-70 family)